MLYTPENIAKIKDTGIKLTMYKNKVFFNSAGIFTVIHHLNGKYYDIDLENILYSYIHKKIDCYKNVHNTYFYLIIDKFHWFAYPEFIYLTVNKNENDIITYNEFIINNIID